MLTTLGGQAPVDAFVAGDVDVAPIELPRRRLDRLRPGSWARRCAATRRCRSPTTASTRARPRSTTSASARRSPRRSTGAAWPPLDEPGSSVPATGMVPAGMPGAPAGRLPAAVRPGRRAAAAGRRRLSRAARACRRSRSSPTAAATTSAIVAMLRGEPRRHDRLRDHGLRRPTRSASRRTRRRSGACPGSPTTRAPTTSWASCWGPAPPPTRAAGRTPTSTPRSPTPPPPASPADAAAGVRAGDGDRAGPGAGGARLLRDVVLAGARWAAGREPDRDGDPAARGPGLGGRRRDRRHAPATRLRCWPLLVAMLAAAWCRPCPCTRADAITFGRRPPRRPTTRRITFTVPMTTSVPPSSASSSGCCFPDSDRARTSSTCRSRRAGDDDAAATRSTSPGDGHIVPNTTITATWAAVPRRRRSPVLSAPLTVHYQDTTQQWQTVKGDLVTVHWYDGPRGVRAAGP